MEAMGFQEVERGGERIWINASAAVWVVPFTGYWQAFRAIEPLKRGRKVWAHDNKRIGVEGEGFPTLEAALTAALAGSRA